MNIIKDHCPDQLKMPFALWTRAVVQGLLKDLIQLGLDAKAKRLYVLGGSKALRSAVHKTFGEATPVQRCQIHKRRNVKEYLPPEHQRAA